MEITSRHHLRSDEIDALESAVEAGLGVALDGDAYEFVEGADADVDVVLVDGEPAVAYFDEEPFLTVVGANARDLSAGRVTVDAGAISFVSDGADVMRPGIVAVDDVIAADDLVVVVGESHGKALAVGRALVDGDEMLGDEGKVVESLHHVGDELFEFSA